MALNTSVDIGTLITKSPEVKSGRAYIAGTGIMVMRIVGWYKLGLSTEEITTEIPHLTLAQVYAALAYYHANQREIEDQIIEEQELYDRYAKEYLEKPTKDHA